MKSICYISASTLPSRSANSIHVVNMSKALSKKYIVTLYARTTNFFKNKSNLNKVYDFYDLHKYKNINVKLVYYPFPRFIEFFITIKFLLDNFVNLKNIKFYKIISRNLFCSYMLSLMFSKNFHIYETHAPERGIRSFFQRSILTREKSIIVVISESLKNILINKYKLSYVFYNNIYCFHDAAPLENINSSNNKNELKDKFSLKKNKLIGYFGNLYAGRGENLIVKLAKKNPHIFFFIFGAKSNNFESHSKEINFDNLIYNEFVPPHKTISLMKSMDILLMPYEEKVYLSDTRNETSKWMSPIKMFEYMSSGIPFISSDILVLKEVLKDKYNCLLAKPRDENDWNKKINFLIDNPGFGKTLAKNSFKEFKNKYNWSNRANSMIHIQKNKNFEDFINYVVDSKIFSKGLMFFNYRYRIFTKNYIKGNFKFYLYKLFGGINFKNKNVLDIGSGTGIFSIYSSFAGAKNVYSLEPEDEGSSELMLDNFFKLKNMFQCDNINIIDKKLQDFYNNDIKFDIVILHNTINHLDEDATINVHNNLTSQKKFIKIFKEIKNMLNEDAEIIITDCSKYNLFGDLGIKNPFAPQIEWEKHNSPYAWKKILLKSEFHSITVEWINHNSLRSIGSWLFGNKYMSYFLNSYFLIKCKT
tara:strand:+ start:29447 stop:31381 length:1935 start_codon:yes stop_codon:yes gene_type:complete